MSCRRDPERADLDSAAAIIEILKSTGETLAVAESCTGGWLGREITSVPGASACFWGGVIAYDNAAKTDLLSVAPGTLEGPGAVSEPAAVEMAAGISALSRATWAVAITGLAGPDGGTPEKPVGTVCLAVVGPVRACRTVWLSGDREDVRRQAVAGALALFREALDSR